MLYVCYRCSKNFKQKGHLLSHLSRKTQCENENNICNYEILKRNKIKKYNRGIYNIPITYPKIDEIENDEDKEFYICLTNNNKNNSICKFCNKELSNTKKKWKHENICEMKIKENLDLLKREELFNKLIKLEKELKVKDKKINNMKKKLERERRKRKKVIKTIVNINCGNTNNIIFDGLKYHNFGNEDTSYVRKSIFEKLVDNPRSNIEQYLKMIHFNPKHPLNHNVRYLNIKDGFMYIYTNNNWCCIPNREFIKLFFEELLDKLEDEDITSRFTS